MTVSTGGQAGGTGSSAAVTVPGGSSVGASTGGSGSSGSVSVGGPGVTTTPVTVSIPSNGSLPSVTGGGLP